MYICLYMKKIITTIILALCISLVCTAISPKDTLRILAIGNSFSEDIFDQDFYGLAEADGVPVVSAVLYRGGCSLEKHHGFMENDEAAYDLHMTENGIFSVTKGVTADEVLRSREWDVVTFQQQSSLALDYNRFVPYMKDIIRYVRKRTPGKVRLMLIQTWAYENASWTTQRGEVILQKYGFRSEGMHKDLVAVARRVADEFKLEVIPVGSAIQNLRTGFTMENTTRDGYHLSFTIGRYTAACTTYEAITGHPVEGNKYAPVTLQNYIRREMAQHDAHMACLHPDEITPEDNGPLGSYRCSAAGPYNFDEDKVPQYTLPDPLVKNDGTPVTTVEQWNNERRAELIELFRREVYGRGPQEAFPGQHYRIIEQDDNAFGGLATRRQVKLFYTENEDDYMVLLIYVPNKAEGPVPAFLAMNLSGTECLHKDPGILAPDENQLHRYGFYGIPAKGQKQERFPIEMILDRGYAFVTFFKADVDPDSDDGFRNGVHKYTHVEGEKYPAADSWGSISAWAWGMSRALDYIETDKAVNASKVVALGHSRGGKTALWATAQDPRFAMAISNCSGCTGAAISRRKKGETVKSIQVTFPSWFCSNYLKYMDNEDALPVDQHELIALVAPRPVYVASATADRGADPQGEFLGLMGADKVYELFGFAGMPDAAQFPEARQQVWGDHMGYHLREGGHNILAFDWIHYLDYADKYLK